MPAPPLAPPDGLKLMGLPNVVGFGRGRRRKGGRDTGESCLTVLVSRKLPLTALAAADRVPRWLGGRRTDVVEVGRLELLGIDRTARLRPARPGVSVGHYRSTAGTLGAVVYGRDVGTPLILSNNHVLANLAGERNGRAAVGDLILQPGPHDGGQPADALARLLRFVPIRTVPTSIGELGLTTLLQQSPLNQVDAAVARPLQPGLVTNRIIALGRVRGTRLARVGLRVRKSGRTSGVTRGRIRATGVTAAVAMGDLGTAIFAGQILTTALARPGDSGSLVVDRRNRAIGLIFAGSAHASLANAIGAVLGALAVTFRPGPA